ncbi:hypothetical protein KNP414_01558 [Paenibacillus mucilaginosus KNP414]|uniref:Uncharacterized protein n=1 Tax=Paenibacillus mucilaginosus (strain KNP414) TaxID=1036673 RepID=F8FNL0_PAEMK|nr:hypothetical protein KNP414_01558 [Paenibacillus mucilaginosus KNP414]
MPPHTKRDVVLHPRHGLQRETNAGRSRTFYQEACQVRDAAFFSETGGTPVYWEVKPQPSPLPQGG